MKTLTKTLATVSVLSLALVGCSVDETAQGNPAPSAIQTQTLNQELHDTLPQKIKDAKKVVAVNDGSFPPYAVVTGNGDITGAMADLATALGEVLGVEIEHTTVDGTASILTGMDAGRYDLALGPIGDFKKRHAQATFVDWVQEFVVFGVPAGNPAGVTNLDSTCGKRIAVTSGGSAQDVITTQSEKCTAAGKPAVEVQSYKDQPSCILAMQSGRADAFFSSQAPLSYYVKQSNGGLELAGTGQHNGFDDLFQGAAVPKDSPMADVLLKGLQVLFDNGTYGEIMKKNGLDGNMIKAPGINLAVS